MLPQTLLFFFSKARKLWDEDRSCQSQQFVSLDAFRRAWLCDVAAAQGTAQSPAMAETSPNMARAVGALHFPAALPQAPFSLQPLLNNASAVFGLGKYACLTFFEVYFSPFSQVQLCAIFVSGWAASTYMGKRWGWLSQENKPSPVFPQHSSFNCVPFFVLWSKILNDFSHFPSKIIAFLM